MTIPLQNWIFIIFLSLLVWAWVIAGGYIGFAFSTHTLHLHSFWLIAPITLAYALAALMILPLLATAIGNALDARARSSAN